MDDLARAYRREVFSRVFKVEDRLDWFQAAIVYGVVGVASWLILERDRAREEIVVTAISLAAAFSVGGVFAIVKTWRAALHVHRDNLQNVARIEKERDACKAALRDALDIKRDRARKLQVVADIRRAGSDLFQRKIREEELEDWQHEVREWVDNAAVLIGENFGAAWRATFERPPSQNAAEFLRSVNEVHNSWLLGLNGRVKVVDELTATV